ncbi:MAG: GNAT family N-acetyltransferase [Clostridiaceae bacterium]
MEAIVRLYKPLLNDLWYRKQLLSDPETMRYNSGYDLNFAGYDRETGCIEFPESGWEAWYNWFCQSEPQRYYAYIVRCSDGVFLGEVNLHQNVSGDWYDMGIVLEAAFRGKEYSTEALRLLLYEAFDRLGATEVRNDFEPDRSAALKAHLAVGFRVIGEENGIVQVQVTAEDFQRASRA